jgi:transposase
MARSYRPVVRDQEFLLPPNMADWLAGDHLVWFVLDVVEQLDTSALHASRRTGGVGRAGYDPDMLLALMIYAYATGQRSSRRIEQLCADHVAYRVLCAQDPPDHTTIARFRAAHDDVFTDVFAQVLRLCAQAGMVRVGSIALDGTKIAANASTSANVPSSGSPSRPAVSPRPRSAKPLPSMPPRTPPKRPPAPKRGRRPN